MTLLLGSCRYQKLFEEEYTFPPRVHSTKEIINVLEQYEDIPRYLRGFPSEMHSSIFGDINHPSVFKLWQEYLHNMNAYQIIHTVILEICSKKYVMFNEKTVCNDFYFNEHLKHKLNIDDTYAYTSHTQSFSEMRDDIVKIKSLIHQRFGNPEIKLVIIPHVNLYSTKKKKIPDREELCNNLLKICNELNIIYASMSDCVPSNATLEEVLPDGFHFKDHKYKNMLKSHVMQKLSNNIKK